MMKKIFVKNFQIVLIFACFIVTSSEFSVIANETAPIINNIIVEGISTYNPSIFLERLPVKKGDAFLGEKTTNSIISSLKEIDFLDNKILVYTRSESDKIDLKIVLGEKKILSEYSIEGNVSFGFESLCNAAKLKSIKYISTHDAKVIAEIIRQKYERKNIFNTDVDFELVDDSEYKNGVKLVLNVKEGTKCKLVDVEIEGCKNVLPSVLKEQLYSKKAWFLSPVDGAGKFDQDLIKADEATIAKYYADRGYYDASVKNVKVKKSKKQDEVKIKFSVEEGPRYKVRFVDAPFDSEFPLSLFKKAISLKRGDFYSLKKVTESMDRIKDIFGSKGYIFCNVYPDIQTCSENGEHFVDVKFLVEKGNSYKVNEIKITGNKKTREYVIRNRGLKIHDGAVASKVGMDATIYALQSLGYFENDHLTWKTSKISDDLVNLELHLKEVKTGNAGLQMSGGPDRGSNSFSVGVMAEYNKRNVAGLGWDIGSSLAFKGDRLNNFVIDFYNPALFDQDLCFGFKAKVNKIKYEDHERFYEKNTIETTSGLMVSLGKYFFPSYSPIKACIDVGIENVSFNSRKIVEKFLDDKFARMLEHNLKDGAYNWLALRLSKDKLNHPLYPSRGWRTDLDIKCALPFLNDKYSMLKTELTGYYFTPLIGEHRLVFSLMAKAGMATPIFEKAPLPFKELYMVGGPDSVRGFKHGECGPMDKKHYVPIGSTNSLLCRFELITPLSTEKDFDVSIPRGYFFYDCGAGWGIPDFKGVDSSDPTKIVSIYNKSRDLIKNKFSLRHSLGFGIRLVNPQPVKLEFGYKLDRAYRSKERTGEWHLNINIPLDM